MVRLGPGAGLTGPNAGKDEKADASETDDAAEDPPDDSGGSEPTRTSAASGTLRALSAPEAGAEDIQNRTLGAIGTPIDAIVDPTTGDTAVASDSQSGGKRGTVNVATPEGGVTAATDQTEDGGGEIVGFAGDTSRLDSLGDGGGGAGGGGGGGSQDTTTTTAGGADPSGAQTTDGGGTSPGDVVDSTMERAQQAFPSSGMGFGGGSSGIGFPGGGDGDGGGLVDTLTSPVGLVLTVVAVAALVFGGSQAVEEG